MFANEQVSFVLLGNGLRIAVRSVYFDRELNLDQLATSFSEISTALTS